MWTAIAESGRDGSWGVVDSIDGVGIGLLVDAGAGWVFASPDPDPLSGGQFNSSGAVSCLADSSGS